jgi:hypothetical protein
VTVINLGEVRAERDATAVATAVLANLAVIQTRFVGYFHVDLGNPRQTLSSVRPACCKP